MRRSAGFLMLVMAVVALPWQSPAAQQAPASDGTSADPGSDGSGFFSDWRSTVAKGKAEQPSWATPMVTSTGRLEERFRFDSAFEQVGNGSNATIIDGGKGFDFMLGETQEIQIALPPYVEKTTPTGKDAGTGFNDWQFLRFKQRLATGNADHGDYIVSALVAFQAPSGVRALTNNAYMVSPSLAAGKGFDAFVLQSTVGFAIPLTHEAALGTQFTTNVALQLHLLRYLWPELEANWTYYIDGTRGNKNQLFLTPGVVLSRFALGSGMSFTMGVAYQWAIAPAYRPVPLLPSYAHAWRLSFRLNY